MMHRNRECYRLSRNIKQNESIFLQAQEFPHTVKNGLRRTDHSNIYSAALHIVIVTRTLLHCLSTKRTQRKESGPEKRIVFFSATPQSTHNFAVVVADTSLTDELPRD